MIFNRLYLIPPIAFAFLFGSIVITYIVAIALNHVREFFPYISDTGTIPPESTVFGQLFNVAAVIIYILFYIRCKQVKTLYRDPNLPHYSNVAKLNRISLWISLPVALGVSIVANFQETNAFIPHLIGAFSGFAFALIYFWIHTIISFITYPTMNSLTMARLRLLIVIVSSFSAGATGLFGAISIIEFLKTKTVADMMKWGPDDVAFEFHIISTVTEWISMILFGFYILTFFKDFKAVALHSPVMEKLTQISSQTTDVGTSNVFVNSLDNVDKSFDEGNNNENSGKAADIGKRGSAILLV